MILKSDAKFEENRFVVSKNLVTFDPRTQKSKKFAL